MKSNGILAVALVAAIVLCVISIGYAGMANSQLSAEKAKIEGLNSRVSELEKQLSGKSAEEAQKIASLQSSLDAANREASKIQIEANGLKAANAELEAKLKAFSDAAAKTFDYTGTSQEK